MILLGPVVNYKKEQFIYKHIDHFNVTYMTMYCGMFARSKNGHC
jgi:hypothetical protein